MSAGHLTYDVRECFARGRCYHDNLQITPPCLNRGRCYHDNNHPLSSGCLRGEREGGYRILGHLPFFCSLKQQFPVRLAFAMTITKAQGQSLQVCGLHLENPCFSHGLLYVACSRVGKPSHLFVYAPGGKTKTIVYPKALE
jgi:ATP-dependent DNA helicase PIF1